MPEKNSKTLQRFLNDAVGILVGKQSEEIAELLNSEKHVNEFLIAKKLNITINQARNLLYKISDHGLVSSIRKKDKKKGWYTYFWKIEALKSLEFLRALLLKKIEQINSQIKSREVKQFYYCPKCGTEYNEENALFHDFACPECGTLLAIKDNSGVLKELKKSQAKLEKELESLDFEIKIETDKMDKKRAKEIKKIQKQKVREREKTKKKAKTQARQGVASLKKKTPKNVQKKKNKKYSPKKRSKKKKKK